jgi:uncharacterized protein (TIGR02444 family)
MSDGDSAFWRFSLRFYARDGVPTLCLALQDEHGVDVNLLFFIIFLSLHGRRLSAVDVQHLHDTTAAWRERAVKPLRALRRDLKSGVAAMDSQVIEQLRGDIKRCELRAERMQQEMLERTFPTVGAGSGTADARETAAANIAAYGSVLGNGNNTLPADIVRALLATLGKELDEQRGRSASGN